MIFILAFIDFYWTQKNVLHEMLYFSIVFVYPFLLNRKGNKYANDLTNTEQQNKLNAS